MAEGGWLEVQHVGWVPWEELDDGAGRFNRARNAEDLLLKMVGLSSASSYLRTELLLQTLLVLSAL